ncbi:MAG: paraquat-inducible protein A [Deltaproteobacteria bacterium]|nr:paraquat-inducible protein A [Deltaproteobacteria bacterium]MBW2070453.1 paraquat-inducible protein A [Deltaproteobacteria bacterium]
MHSDTIIACHECDLLQRVRPLPPGGVARCSRCGGILLQHKRHSLDRTLSFTIAGIILFVVANTYPFLALKSGSLVQETTLFTGIRELSAQGMPELAVLVFVTTILIPLLQLLGMVYVLGPLKFNKTPPGLAIIFRCVRSMQPWGMMEVFMLGILVSVVKLAKMASIVPGLALYSFAILIFVLAAAAASLDPHIVWERVAIEK